ncbi:MAG: peptidylprolyl isomerase [Chloroflexi bacterium]|nr:peptidylprolyl isomerase [Chloroflexota bacterium]
MSQAGKKRTNRPPAEHPLPHPVERHGRGTAIAIAAAVLILILAIVGIIGYPTYIAPFQKTIITVDDTNIRMDYFLKRIKLTGSDPIAMLTELTNDQLIKLGAPRYGISVSPEDIDQTLRSVFQGQSDNTSGGAGFPEREFQEWYRQRLNESGLTDKEYRDIIATEIYRSRLQEHLARIMPTIAEQIHLYAIVVEKEKEAQSIRDRWLKGEKFSDLATQLSLDRITGDKGGEVGWFPEGGILTPQIEFEAFDLATGNMSQPIPIIDQNAQQPDGSTAPTVVGYQLLMVTERGERELDENAKQVLRSKVVDTWLTTERQGHKIEWRGLSGSFDSETYAWINYQLAKSKPAGSQQPSQQ